MGDIGSHILDTSRFLLGEVERIEGAALATFITRRPIPAEHVVGHATVRTTGEHGTPSVENGIVQTWEFEGAPGHVSLQTATFEGRNGRTVVTDNAVFQSIEARDANIDAGMADGVLEGHARLDALLKKLAKSA